MKGILAALVAGTIVSGVAAVAQSSPQARVSLTRLDCGTIAANDLNLFSDTDAYVGKSRDLVSSCYLIRHDDGYLLWDAGLPAARKGQPIDRSKPLDSTLRATIVEQLAELGIRPEQIGRVAVSHAHFDHIGQAGSFPGATLMIGANDWTALTAEEPDPRLDPEPLRHWISGGGKVDRIEGDRDIFGDGTVRMIALPGHTPGHHALLIRLRQRGYVFLTGDQAHFTDNYEQDGVPSFNTNRADTLASFRRFKDMARHVNATVIIQHEPDDVARLPAFPRSAE